MKSDIIKCKKIWGNRLNWDDSLHICFGVDSNYVRYAGITMLSIMKNNEENIVFHIFLDKVNIDDEVKLLELFEFYTNIEINLYFVDNERISHFPQGNGWNLSIYYRALAPNVLHGTVKRVLYLDADIICIKSIRAFFDVDLDGYVSAVVSDGAGKSNTSARLIQLKCPENVKYFNSGVMLINVDEYVKNDVLYEFVDVIEKRGSELFFWDQDAFNIIIGLKVVYVDDKWNFQKLNQSKNDVSIVHFAGVRKPWFLNYNYFYFENWRELYRESPWRDIELSTKSFIKPSEYRYQAGYFFDIKEYFNALKSYLLYLKYKCLQKRK